MERCITHGSVGFQRAQLEWSQELEKPAAVAAKQRQTFDSLPTKAGRLVANRATYFDTREFGELLKRWDTFKGHRAADLRQLQLVNDGDLQIGRKLGQGGQGAVFEALWQGAKVAVKKFSNRQQVDLPREELALFVKEAMVHMALNHHPHIVQLLATTASCGVVMEWADSDLHTLCHTGREMSWRSKARLLQQGATALAYMHRHDVVHGDIKSRNFLVIGNDPDTCRLKISDFGFSRDMTSARSRLAGMDGGTVPWTAPEAFEDKPVDRKKCDVYSFGVVCYECTSRQQPYDWENTNMYAIMMKKALGEEPCTVAPHSCPPQMLHLMRQCCARNPEDRPTMEDVSNALLKMPELEPCL